MNRTGGCTACERLLRDDPDLQAAARERIHLDGPDEARDWFIDLMAATHASHTTG